MLIEICANTVQSGIIAEKLQIRRIELCAALPLGGITPSPAALMQARKLLSLQICALIRPREGDFCYSDLEFEQILEDVHFCKSIGINGVVVGILTPDGCIDTKRMTSIKKATGNMQVVCHRAFDYTRNPFDAMEQLIDLGFDRILTAGQRPKVIDNLPLVAKLIEKANERICIMPGSGITPENIQIIQQTTGAKELHLSAGAYTRSLMQYQPHEMQLNNSSPIPEFDYYESSEAKIKELF